MRPTHKIISTPARWAAVWVKIFTQPGERTFLDAGASPDANPKTAFLWIFLSGFLFVLSSGFSFAIQTGIDAKTAALILCIALGVGGMLVISFIFSIVIKQWIAARFGGSGTFASLAYVFGALYAPFALIASAFVLLAALPWFQIAAALGIGASFLYILCLQIAAVKALNRLGWKHAALSVLIPFAGVLLTCSVSAPLLTNTAAVWFAN